jgi:hypothetical protein
MDGTRIPNTCQTKKSILQLSKGLASPAPLTTTATATTPTVNKIKKDPSPKEIWSKLEKAYPSCNKKESCIVKSIQAKFAMPEVDVFAPLQPKNWKNAKMGDYSTFWTSADIQRVFQQYEKAYPTFHSIPLSFINYDTIISGGQCVTPELCSFSIEKYKQQGKTDICVIFNTDTYGGKGLHWIFVYLNIPKKHVVFFDSVGDPPPPEIDRFVNMLKKQDPTLKYTRICKPHQKLDGECGTYCIFGALLLLTGKLHISMDHPVQTWEDRIRFLKYSRLPDRYIWSYRNYYMHA